jgi:hypothetical protein
LTIPIFVASSTSRNNLGRLLKLDSVSSLESTQRIRKKNRILVIVINGELSIRIVSDVRSRVGESSSDILGESGDGDDRACGSDEGRFVSTISVTNESWWRWGWGKSGGSVSVLNSDDGCLWSNVAGSGSCCQQGDEGDLKKSEKINDFWKFLTNLLRCLDVVE